MKLLAIFVALAGACFAQNPNPCSNVQNSATKGQVLGAATSGRPPQCQWVTGGGGGGSVSITATSPIVITPSPTTGTGVISAPTAVVGPASVISGHIATFNGTTGKLIQDGGAVPVATTPASPVNSIQFNSASSFGSVSNTVVLNGGTNVIAGALAANTRLLLTANVTQNASAIALSQDNVTIECTAGVKITFATSSVDGIDISGSDDQILGCILDGNGALTKPLVNVSGNGAILRGDSFQNTGVTSPSLANVYVHDCGRVKIIDNFWNSPVDAALLITNTVDNSAVVNILVQSNTVTGFNPGSAALNGFFATSNVMNARFVTGIKWINNVMTCRGANANCMGQNMDISPTGEGPGNHEWRGNQVILNGNVADGFHLFGNYHETFSENSVLNDSSSTFAVSKYFSFGDSYHSIFHHNIVKNPAGFYTGNFVFADLGYDIIDGNICDGGTGNSTTAGCIYTFSTSGINSHNVISNNLQHGEGAFAYNCIRVESSSMSFTTVDNQIIGNHCDGTGTSGQVGIQIVDSSGTLSGTYIADNYLSNMPTGISIGSGATDTRVGSTFFDTVTTMVSDSGTRSRIDTHTTKGTCVIGTSCSVTFANNDVYTSSTSYICTATNASATLAVRANQTSGTAVAFTEAAGTDTVNYSCTGY